MTIESRRSPACNLERAGSSTSERMTDQALSKSVDRRAHSSHQLADRHAAPQVRKFERLINGLKNPRRGHLASICTINCPPDPRAFSLVWPQVAVAFDGLVVVYDVRQYHSFDQVPLVQPQGVWRGPVRYISMDKDFIFILRGHRMPLPSIHGQDYDHEFGGLYVYERGSGSLIFDAETAPLACASAWDIRAQDLDRLRFEGRPLSSCASLGIATTLSPNHQPDKGEYETTSWCQAVQPDSRTGSLVLSGADRMMIIPDSAKAFREGASKRPVGTIGVGGGDDSRGRCTSQLGVADGVAAFVSPVSISCAHHTFREHSLRVHWPLGQMHNLPSWIDLQSLIDASSHGDGSAPRASTLCLGQSVLCDHTAIIFQKSSSIHLNSTRLVVVADFLREDATAQPAKYKASFLAVVMDFGAVLRAKLNFPLEPFDEKPSRVTISFPRRTRPDEEEQARWRESREAWPLAKVLLPSTETKWWHPWARRYILGQSSSKRRRTSPSRSEVKTPRKAPRGFHWRGRVLSDLGFGGTPFWDLEFTEKMMEKHFGLHAAGYEYEDWTDSDAEHGCGADGEGDEDEEEAMFEEGERLRAEIGGVPVTTKTTMEVKGSDEPLEAYTEVPGESTRTS